VPRVGYAEYLLTADGNAALADEAPPVKNPEVKAGQEWEKEHTDGVASGPYRIRVLEDLRHPQSKRVKVGTVAKDGRLIREREILVSALSNTPSGYRLVKDTPTPADEEITFSNVRHGKTAEMRRIAEEARARGKAVLIAAAQPAPLARVREVLEHFANESDRVTDRNYASGALGALAPLERVFPDAMQALHDTQRHWLRHGADSTRWAECQTCAALLEDK